MISDEDCVRGLKAIQDGGSVLKEMGVAPGQVAGMYGLFGISGICNILGAIKMAH